MKKILIIIVILILIALGVYFITKDTSETVDMTETITTEEPQVTEPTQEETDDTKTVIGTSVENRDITAYHYGEGNTELLFVGGIHGGYEWNTSLVAYELMDYLEENPTVIPENVQVTVVPVLNPDGLYEVVGTTEKFSKTDVPSSQDATIPGRFNGNGVDLNRNFDCDWESTGVWQNAEVDGGTSAFSEPESKAIQNYINTHNPEAVVVWYSAANGVFASSCHNGVLTETTTLTNLYAEASGYPAYEEFNFYEITGDMVNWLAKEGVPAISVLLSTHDDIEWSKNKAGIDALLEYYSN
tara:strand:- start:370 stop:1266 length:897 start_codon:yes stop_codon:yes gene_type:complete